ncbi:HAD family phosphatase [Streptomyces sp. NBC_00102]|uniref:HAD family hydrolase n=1 Tax=Streptomyces sp. NBC_00102 TaxID=2975652 RepID=UPI00225C17E3|nr:HAD-IB family hydrolase [Streptomyces sp. NBC_00102]MCX5401505.1 HAD-IB family hydrolase [Streptomyces sp. NBC_00102]
MTAVDRKWPALAFFDVDETVIAAKSMVAFREYWLARTDPSRAEEDASALRAATRTEPDREALNRWYYRRYAGVPLADLEAAGRLWYDTYRRGASAFVLDSVEALAEQRAAGRGIVLVSGSMHPVLTPLAEELEVAAVLCTELEVGADGLLTGEVLRPMIGEAKAEAAIRFMRERAVDPGDCFAYGDHESDLALLRAVGRPVVVGASGPLNSEAARCGWTVLSGRPGPLRQKPPSEPSRVRCPRGNPF